MVPLKKQLEQLELERKAKISTIIFSSKKQHINKIRHQQNPSIQDANTRKRDKKHPKSPLKGHKTAFSPLVPMLLPLPRAHNSGSEFHVPHPSRKEPCGQNEHHCCKKLHIWRIRKDQYKAPLDYFKIKY